MEKITDYKIKIGDKLDYFIDNTRLPVEVTNMLFDGFVFLIEFKHDSGKEMGVTQYPNRLLQKLT